MLCSVTVVWNIKVCNSSTHAHKFSISIEFILKLLKACNLGLFCFFLFTLFLCFFFIDLLLSLFNWFTSWLLWIFFFRRRRCIFSTTFCCSFWVYSLCICLFFSLHLLDFLCKFFVLDFLYHSVGNFWILSRLNNLVHLSVSQISKLWVVLDWN